MSALVRALLHIYADLENRNEVDDFLSWKIDLDRAFKILSESRTLTDMERQVVMMVSTGCSNNQGSKELGLPRTKYLDLLRSASIKMADFLGKEYSDNIILTKIEHRLGRTLSNRETRKVLHALTSANSDYKKDGILGE